jgi:hypothetical protein
VPKFVADSVETTGLKWVAPAGGGKVLQVVSFSTTSTTSVATGNTSVTALTLSITPSAATSKVLVLISQPIVCFRGNPGGTDANVALKRAGTTLGTIGNVSWNNFTISSGNGLVAANVTATYLDSPNTTSSTTYDTHLTTSVGGTAEAHKTQTITLLEIGA